MKEDNEFKNLSPEEKLKAENEMLKIKLNAEFGMINSGDIQDDRLNNEWLNHIYEFEKQYAENKQIKVYDFIGKPAFKKIHELNKELVTLELNRLREIMMASSVTLDTICDYDDETIYRFITEELFEKETDDIRIPGMMLCYIYEEFHPNHPYDLKERANEFISLLIGKRGGSFENHWHLEKTICFNERLFTKEEFAEVVKSFQSLHQKMKLLKFNIQTVKFDLENSSGLLDGVIDYKLKTKEILKEPVHFDFILSYDWWIITKVLIPGISFS